MAKKIEDTEVKTTATKKTTAKSTAKASTKTAAKNSKVAKTAKDKPDTKAEAKEEEKKAVITDITPEDKAAPPCQQMLSSIIDWSMDALMFQNIITLSQKMNISIEKAAGTLDVKPEELYALIMIHGVLSVSPDKKTVLGKYADRIKPYEPVKKPGRKKKDTDKK